MRRITIPLLFWLFALFHVTEHTVSDIPRYLQLHSNIKLLGHPYKKCKFSKSRVQYDHNSISTYNIDLTECGDVHSNPGPESNMNHNNNTNRNTPPIHCHVCERKIAKNRQQLKCFNCSRNFHASCVYINPHRFRTFLKNRSSDWCCHLCALPKLNDLFFSISSDTNENDALLNLDPLVCGINNDSSSNSDSIIDPAEVLKGKGMHFLHVNARSLLPKISELRTLVGGTKVAVIAVTETHLDSSITDNEIHIPDFQLYRQDRARAGGGICLYFKSTLAVTMRSDCDNANIQALWFEVHLPRTRPIIVGVCYRPPKQRHGEFIDGMDDIMEQLPRNSEIYIFGDTNMCSLKKDSNYIKFQQTLHISGMSQIMSEPTRICDSCESCLDHIITNSSDKLNKFGVLSIGFSDHFPIYATRHTQQQKHHTHKKVKIRSTKNYNREKFIRLLQETDWDNVLKAETVDCSWQAFCVNFTNVLDKVALVKEVRIRHSSQPWMTPDILKIIKARDIYLKKFKRTRNLLYRTEYCKLRNQVQRNIKEAKQTHFIDKINTNRHNPKKLWKVIKDLGYQNKQNETASITLKINDKLCSKPNIIASHFNSFFTNVASDLVRKLPQRSYEFDVNSENFKKYYDGTDKFSLQPVNNDIVKKEILGLSINKSTGLDGIPARFLRDASEIIATPITRIINFSFETECFPNEMKLARVRPIYKKKK
ncbi:uncharacterized protein [Antedon mediterranea]|uniref:uncharacterized protein n=1 Tax=Antedon mediterranea TaxID=105859 RepID=UPI003AF74C60